MPSSRCHGYTVSVPREIKRDSFRKTRKGAIDDNAYYIAANVFPYRSIVTRSSRVFEFNFPASALSFNGAFRGFRSIFQNCSVDVNNSAARCYRDYGLWRASGAIVKNNKAGPSTHRATLFLSVQRRLPSEPTASGLEVLREYRPLESPFQGTRRQRNVLLRSLHGSA